jgi:hypothetical protein
VVFLQTLLKIIHRELVSMDRSSWMFWRGMGVAAQPVAGASPIITATGPPQSPEFQEPPPTTTPPQAKPSGNGHASPGQKPPQQKHKKRRR